MLLCMPGKSLSEDVQKYSYYLLIGYRYLSQVTSVKVTCYWIFNASLSPIDEFKGHSLLQAAREADLAKVKKTLALEIINFKQPQSHETALVRLQRQSWSFMINVMVVLVEWVYFYIMKMYSSSEMEDLPSNTLYIKNISPLQK